MGCDCEHVSEKMVTRLDPGTTPPTVIGQAIVLIQSRCRELPSSGDDEDGVMFLAAADFDRAVMVGIYGGDPRAGKHAAPSARSSKVARQAAGRCFNYIDVTLLRGTQGWKITEVQVGGDVFVANIAVGGTERYVLGACESCEKEPASVKVSDAAGNVQATIAGLKACHCQSG